jgi:glycosyltransferase involved in cell wall biosynthesis
VLYSTPLLLLEEHGRFFPEVENKKRAFVNRLIIRRLTHRFVAVSNDVRTRLQRYEGLKKDRIDVVYNGVKAEPAISQNERARRRAELGFGPEEFIVGTVGRFDPIKNLPLFVKSLANLKNEAPATLGLLVGDGPVLPEISEMVKRLGLSDRVSLPGHRDDARQLIPCMDLFVLSSFSEGTSMALLEAMAAGVPTLVTDVGGNPEIIVKNQTGWLVPSDSVEDLTAAITDAVNNPSKRQKFAQAGKRRFEERFTFDIMIDNYRKIYNEMIEDRKR